MSDPKRRGIIFGVSLGLMGCGILPGSGPDARRISADSSDEKRVSYSLVEIMNLDQVVSFNTARRLSPINIKRYSRRLPWHRITRGDVLSIAIFESSAGGLFGTAATGGYTLQNVLVGDDGTISIPYVKVPIVVSGATTRSLARLIKSKLVELATDPHVLVTIVRSRTRKVVVAGAVPKPGAYEISRRDNRLLDVIAAAGGSTAKPLHTRIILHRRKHKYYFRQVDLFAYPAFRLSGGESVILKKDPLQIVALGAVSKPGTLELEKRTEPLIDVLGKIGGLADNRALRSGVFVFRDPSIYSVDERVKVLAGDHTKRWLVFRFNFTKPATLPLSQRFRIFPNDIIYVANSPLADVRKVLAIIGQAVGVTRAVSTVP